MTEKCQFLLGKVLLFMSYAEELFGNMIPCQFLLGKVLLKTCGRLYIE